MRAFRSAVAFFSTLAVMACQTAATVTGGIRPTTIAAASASPTAVPVAAQPVDAFAPAKSPFASADSQSRRRTYLIAAGAAVLVIAGYFLFKGGSSDY